MNDIRRCLEECDIPGIRAAWAKHAPHLPQPENDAEAEVSLHYARTQARSLGFKARAWSHRWLSERDLPSGLPDHLRQPAERMYPVVVSAVGIAVGATSDLGRAIAPLVQRAMSDAVLDCYANGDRASGVVSARMFEAKANETRRLIGAVNAPREA